MIGDIFDLILIDPMVNILVVLTVLLFGSFGLAVIAFTIIVRVITFPLTLRQLQQTRAMQSLQPLIQDINKKHSDPKRRQQELMKAYKEAGVNPLGCLGPMALQFPILIALFYAIRKVLPQSPEALEGLSGRLYDFSLIQHAVPLEEHFLGLDLREPHLLLVGLVAITTWAQMKTTVSYATDDRAKTQQQMMTWMLPLMLGFFALNFPSGLSLYWTVNSVVGIAFNIVTYGFPMLGIQPLIGARTPVKKPAADPDQEAIEGQLATATQGANGGSATSQPARESRTTHGQGRSKRKNRRRRS
ncbi:MAG: YidC/Oxa1 family membrane protein insertase [Dehalococcoidia bacterium]|nr:YidC/Oxa1 family membrane protein insertase [Dehalococcoidia bacterium]